LRSGFWLTLPVSETSQIDDFSLFWHWFKLTHFSFLLDLLFLSFIAFTLSNLVVRVFNAIKQAGDDFLDLLHSLGILWLRKVGKTINLIMLTCGQFEIHDVVFLFDCKVVH